MYYGILILEPSTFGGDIVVDFSDSSSMTAVLHDLLYFSFITQTTLGYGDLSPTLNVARTLATFQVIMGQLYIAFNIARLVGIYSATATMEQNKK